MALEMAILSSSPEIAIGTQLHVHWHIQSRNPPPLAHVNAWAHTWNGRVQGILYDLSFEKSNIIVVEEAFIVIHWM